MERGAILPDILIHEKNLCGKLILLCYKCTREHVLACEDEEQGAAAAKALGWTFIGDRAACPNCPALPVFCAACNDTGLLKVDTTEEYQPYWSAGDEVVACCTFCQDKRVQ